MLSVVEIRILDDKDKVPEVIFTFISTMITEDSSFWTVIALFRTQDPDSGENREVTCLVQDNAPFRI